MLSIKLDDLTGCEIIQLLEEHLEDMRATSPPESKHALDLQGLRDPSVKFWTIWSGDSLAGCGAVKRLTDVHAEIKSMRTATGSQGQGVASTLLQYIISDSIAAGYKRLSLETGSMDFFSPARKLYRKYGFVDCAPFADYVDDPNSVFMRLDLTNLV